VPCGRVATLPRRSSDITKGAASDRSQKRSHCGERLTRRFSRSVSPAVSRTTYPAGVDHVSATMPSAPGFETAAASWGTADIGAWTIGCSIPSRSQTGVRTNITYLFAPTPAPATSLHVDPSRQHRRIHMQL
jgi:hypothetical protein